MMTHRKLGRRRDQICDHWNGSASDGCDTIWPYWVFGIAAVAIVAIIAVGMQKGGVGWYPQFKDMFPYRYIHVDTGRVRHWGFTPQTLKCP